MSDFKVILPKVDRTAVPDSGGQTSEEHRQRVLMAGSLCLLLIALGIILWHDRDFWFPDTTEAEIDLPVESTPVETAPARKPVTNTKASGAAKTKHQVAAKTSATSNPAGKNPATTTPAPPMTTTTTRTVLPPLEVEVVAGDTHRTVRPGSSSVHVDLQPGMPTRPATDTVSGDTENAAHVTSDAAERVQMSADTSAVVTRSVRPNYPLLARQMKVEGSVVLQALIGKDGIIQSLRVLSGPHILALAAEDAVRQWHFKPHFEGNQPVETQARITVNFTISTN